METLNTRVEAITAAVEALQTIEENRKKQQ
jgi:hypothetical protein